MQKWQIEGLAADAHTFHLQNLAINVRFCL